MNDESKKRILDELMANMADGQGSALAPQGLMQPSQAVQSPEVAELDPDKVKAFQTGFMGQAPPPPPPPEKKRRG